MQQTGTYRETKRVGLVSDIETWLGNALATILAGLAVAAGVIGLLVAFDYIGTSVNEPFQNGVIWMAGGLILAVSANAFRREHHIVGDDALRSTRGRDVNPADQSSPRR